MKKYFIFLISLSTYAGQDQLSNAKMNAIVNAIYRIENSKQYPYGIKSIKTSNPRKICENTVKNNYKRWIMSGRKNEFLDFLADRYCPSSCDKIGNINWKRNIKYYIKDI